VQVQAPEKNTEIRRWSREIVNEIRDDFKIVPVNSLKSMAYTLTKPLLILIEKENDQYIASLDDIEAFHTADTEYEAVNGLCDEIIQLYEDLSESGSKLGPLPEKWLIFLRDYLKSNEEKRD